MKKNHFNKVEIRVIHFFENERERASKRVLREEAGWLVGCQAVYHPGRSLYYGTVAGRHINPGTVLGSPQGKERVEAVRDGL